MPSLVCMQIAISSRGVLRVTHMLTLAGGAPLASLEAQPLLGTLTSQVGGACLSNAGVQACMCPNAASSLAAGPCPTHMYRQVCCHAVR